MKMEPNKRVKVEDWVDSGVPTSLVQFWHKHGVDPGLAVLEEGSSRYVRVTALGHACAEETLERLHAEWPEAQEAFVELSTTDASPPMRRR